MSSTNTPFETTKAAWQEALSELPEATGEGAKIPAFFFAHGSPVLVWPSSVSKPSGSFEVVYKGQGPESRLAHFLRDFGPALLKKYQPRGIVVFSAHWETFGETLVTDYEPGNPLLYDYYNFDGDFYDIKFSSKGDSGIAKEVVELLKEAGIEARTTPASEPRGRDGRGFKGPGLDHGVFVPFKVMFGDSVDIPIVQVSIDGSLSPEKNWALGKAIAELRSKGILILSGGLTVHTFQDYTAWSEETASKDLLDLHQTLLKAVREPADSRQAAMTALVKHKAFRQAHPREEHFIPIYVAAGAGEDGASKILHDTYAIPTFAFGL